MGGESNLSAGKVVGKTTQNRQLSDQLLQAIFEHASEGILVAGADGCICQVNPRASTLLGVAGEALLGVKVA
ncbi:MAG: PAS domain-containing protein, partial [Candidatus Eremiobacteraeota bacterium]|nr:PAS domain-containing protein [Candidatus Eremiobacteraeota bacterium]